MFKLKFEKSKYPIKKIAFWLLVLFSLFSIFNILKTYKYNFEVKNLNSVLKPIVLNLEFGRKINSKMLFCFNNYCTSPDIDSFFNVYSYRFDNSEREFFKEKTEKIHISFEGENKNYIKHINNISLYIGNDKYYFNKDEIKNFKEKKFEIETDEDGVIKKNKYIAFELPVSKDNYSGVFNHICVLFLSLFYSANVFIVPYFWLFIAFCIYYFNKEEFKFNFKLNSKINLILFGAIFLLGGVLRLNHILYFPLWTDEVYTKTIAIRTLKTCFQDAGNPPLFFLLEKVVSFFSSSDFALRFLPFLFGLGFIFSIYLIFKKISPKFALLASFLASINTINIYHSQEARGYSLSMFLSVLSIYFLNNYLENSNSKTAKKALLFYSLIVIFSLNNNYLLLILMFSNFLYGLFYLLFKKSPKIKEFIFSQVLCALTFLPYFLISSKIALNGTFNGWIEPLNFKNLTYILNNYFINKYIFFALFGILILTLALNYIFKKENRKFYLQINLIFFLAILMIALISIFVKPIMHKRTLLSLYGFLFLIEISSIYFICNLKIKFKILEVAKILFCVFLTFFLFKMTSPIPVRELCRLDDFSSFVLNDQKQYENKGFEIHYLVSDNKDYFKQYPELYNNNKAIWHFIDTNKGEIIQNIQKKDYVKGNKKAIIYSNAIGVDVQSALLLNPKARYFRTNSVGNIKMIYD